MTKPSVVIDTRVIYCGDNLDQLRKLPGACVDLIYIDPPFNSNRNYEVFWGETKEKRAFEDRHASTQAYIEFMRSRCVELRRVLKKTGSFYYHCDWHASHYVKVMLDQIFGQNQFQNEIVWKRTTAHGDAQRAYSTVTDSILYFTGSDDSFFQREYVAHDPEYIADKYRYTDSHGRTLPRLADRIGLGSKCYLNVSETANFSLRTPINRFVWKCLRHFQEMHQIIEAGKRENAAAEKTLEGYVFCEVSPPQAHRRFVAGMIHREEIPIYAESCRLPPLTKDRAVAKRWADVAIMPYVKIRFPDLRKVPELKGIKSGVSGQSYARLRKAIVQALEQVARRT
jgi:hypothetical protein